ncbi:hypothetical protein [Nocardiopsis sp. FIRDI 009]|uniref:hypothetical protein n=1 Tax=Nocardiopsis sp. FIRDI 009 TaxID=714197 RepID=UPI000E23ED34|nr:hypothetical protein [Nocardiopsis sp. FIRDI 009]
MNNETLDRLRPLGAWVLLGAVGATLLSGLVRLIVRASDYTGGFAFGVESAASSFFGLWHVILLATAVALVVTSERTRPSAAPVVVTAMIMVGVGLLFAMISLITGFIVPENVGIGFAGFFTTLAQGAVLGLLGFVLLKVFNDPTLVPRATPQGQYNPQQSYGVGQQPYAQPGYPAADPTQTGSGQVYGQNPAQAASGQQQGYAQYGQEAQPYDASAQQGYDAQQQVAYGTGGQQAYDPSAQQAYGTGAQQAYDPSAQQGYDPSAQQGYDAQQQVAYGTGGQQAYDPSAQQAYGTGAQQAYDPSAQQAYGTGAQQAYDPSAQQAYGQQYGDASAPQQSYAYGTGAQQSYDPSQYAQQYGQQDASAQAYDPAQYAPQSYDAQQGGEQAVSSGEQAAQDAIQYGWYQGADQGQQAQQAQDTPSDSGVDPFFNSGEQAGADASGQSGASYGSQYEAGSGYGSDQQGQGNSGGQQGWYGGEGNR